MRPRRSGGRDVPAFGRALGAPFAPHAPFADVGAECEIVAHQELVDGRLLVRCRAKRHVRLLDARKGGRRGGVPRRARGTRRGRRGGAAARRENSRRRGRDAPRSRQEPRTDASASARCTGRCTATPLTAREPRRARGSSGGFDRSSRGGSARLGDDARYWAKFASPRCIRRGWRASRVAPRRPGFPARRRRDPRLCSGTTFTSIVQEATWIICLGGAARVRARIDSTISRGGWPASRTRTRPSSAAVELRGECLAATSAKARFRVIHEKLVESMREVHRMRPSQWRGARPLASVNVAMASAPRVGGTRPRVGAPPRGHAFGDGEGPATATGTIAAFLEGTTTRASWRRRSARSKTRADVASPLRSRRRRRKAAAAPVPRAIPRCREPAGGDAPGADRDLLVRFDRHLSSRNLVGRFSRVA